MTSCKLGGEKLLLTVFEDISERMEAQRKLSESEYKYKLLTENQKDVVFFSLMALWNIAAPPFWNLAATTLLGKLANLLRSI
jgi:hypothetical protein